MEYRIEFEPVGRRGACPAEQSLLECARQLGIDLISLCGGEGTCGRCKVQVLSGEVSPLTDAEHLLFTKAELQAGYRLACQTFARSDVQCNVPAESLSTPQRTQVEGLEVPVAPQPAVRAFEISLEAPSMHDLRSDMQRMRAAAQAQGGPLETGDIELLREISPLLRANAWKSHITLRGSECVALSAPGARMLGLAVDMGTTKVAGYLVDLNTGHTLASKGIMNPQIAYGEDVITRINRARSSPSEAQRMQDLAAQALNELAESLCAEMGTQTRDIVDAVVVGNTAIHHLLVRLPVEQLALAPYVPAVSDALDIKARQIGLHIAPGAYVHLPPNVAGFVGADHIAMLLGIEATRAQGVVLAMDIGTNTEVCLIHHGRMTSVSCASGPAFEGAHIRHGMRAADGAIEQLRLADSHVEYHTIGNTPPVGLCGSGILDTLAQLHLQGVVDRTGRMKPHPRVRNIDGQTEFVIVSTEERGGEPAIVLTQHDVRELQLAKGAMRTGVQTLLEANGLRDEQIDQVTIAGAFGSYIDVSSAITIGMLPPLPLERFRQVGNAAGTGARLALISMAKRQEAREIARHVDYIELGTAPHFSEIFAESMYLGTYNLESKEK